MYLCRICGQNTKKIVDIKKDITYYRCKSCGFIYLDNKNIIDSCSEKKHYEKHNNGFDSLGYVKMFEDFIDVAIEPYIKSIKTALDFGCGKGPVLAELLHRKGIEVDKYDIYFYPKEVYKGKKYDLITSTEVFEHIKEPIESLKLLSQYTNKNGYIILMTKFPPLNKDEFLNWWYRRDITHISFFTPKSFEIMAKKMDLKIVKTLNNNIVIFQKC